MDGKRASLSFTLLFVLSIFSLHSKVIYGYSTVVFINSPTRQYLRQPSSQTDSLSPSELGAVASVLLGLAPPSTLSAASSSKLNEVLTPNPFDRPRAVLILEVTGAEEFPLIGDSAKSPSNSAVRIKVEGDQRVEIHLPDEHDVSFVTLAELENTGESSDKEMSDFASWLAGSYVEDASCTLSGELTIPVANSDFLRLNMREEADRKFALGLLFLVNSIRSAKEKETHELLTKSWNSPAELITGRFDGIKALQDHYGKEGIAQSGLAVLANAISKAFDSLQGSYQGKIVAVIAHGNLFGSQMENIFQVTGASRAPSRLLEEIETQPIPIEVAEMVFVRTTLAWITGIILLIATLLGIFYLLNMPLTKDTLLYSNIKLD